MKPLSSPNITQPPDVTYHNRRTSPTTTDCRHTTGYHHFPRTSLPPDVTYHRKYPPNSIPAGNCSLAGNSISSENSHSCAGKCHNVAGKPADASDLPEKGEQPKVGAATPSIKSASTNKYKIIVIVVVLGYGYVWWKGWKLPNMIFATKQSLSDAINVVAKKLDDAKKLNDVYSSLVMKDVRFTQFWDVVGVWHSYGFGVGICARELREFSADSEFMTDEISGGEGFECCQGWKESHHRFFPVDTSLIHVESHKSPTKSLLDIGSSRISIFIMNVFASLRCSGNITRIMRRTLKIILVFTLCEKTSSLEKCPNEIN
ncbi:acetolactate synthase [Tanacetum coccineum]